MISEERIEYVKSKFGLSTEEALRVLVAAWKHKYYGAVERHNNLVDQMVRDLQALKKMVREYD